MTRVVEESFVEKSGFELDMKRSVIFCAWRKGERMI